MARIPDAEIEQLKEATDLLALVQAKGVTLVRHGADWHGRCPFHEDRTPSLVVSPVKGLWHCLGACSTGGTAIDWVMKAENVAFRDAVERLRAVPLTAAVASPSRPKPADALPVSANADDATLLSQVVADYHATLKASPEALAYLASRGLDHAEVADHFKLGHANRTLGLRLPEKTRKAGAQVRGALQRVGVLRASGHEHFNGSLVVPLCDASDAVVGMYGRKIAPVSKLTPGTPLHLYLPGPHRGVFNAQGLNGQAEAIVCEAVIDALTFWCAGHRNVTCAYGVNGVTEELMQALQTAGIQRVLIAFDRDEAGEQGAQALASKLQAVGIDCYRIQFPKGMDANAYALNVQPASKSLALVIRQAEWMGNGVAPAREVIPAVSLVAAVAVEQSEGTSNSTSGAAAAPPPSLPDDAQGCASGARGRMPDAPPPAHRVAPSVPALPVEIDDKELRLVLGTRTYTVRAIEKNLSYEQLKVWVRAQCEAFVHVDTVELYQARQRAAWVKQTAIELGVAEDVIKADLGSLLRAVEQRQDELIRAKLSPKESRTAPAWTPEQQDAALALLRDPHLVERIVQDVSAIGVVGEDSNALVGYLACVSRKLDKPLAVLIQSTSAAGKSTLMDALLSLMPESERVQYSAMTGQSLFYLGEGDLKHKILAIAEEEGVRQAAYALKLLQSQGELTIASTGKDPTTGALVTAEYRVEGPVMLVLTTTAIDIDEELLNRCLVLTINESREQTEAIHVRQRQARTLQGLLTHQRGASVRTLHQAAQSLLRPLAVVNPFAEALTFRSESTRMRRDHAKYLTLIDAIAFLHQHQRPVQTAVIGAASIEYVEVTLADIALANRLAHDVLGRSLDELPPQTRRVLGVVDGLVTTRMHEQSIRREAVRFSRRELRAVAGMTDTALRVHLDRLVELEYVLVHRGGPGQRFVYELLFDGDAAADLPQLIGLRDAALLASVGTTENRAPQTVHLASRLHPERTPLASTVQHAENALIASTDAGSSSLAAAVDPIAHHGTLPMRRRNGSDAVAVR